MLRRNGTLITRSHAFCRLQASLKGDPHGYTGMVQCFTKILEEEGPRALYKGLAPNLLKVVPAASITYVVYEGCKKQLNIR